MVYVYEHLSEFDIQCLKTHEPFIDFSYSFNKGMYYWQRHHRIVNYKNVYTLRLHELCKLKQGFICTDFDEAKLLAILIEGKDDFSNLQNEYPWLEKYLFKRNATRLIEIIALPVSEYIRIYSRDFSKLKLLDFEKILNFRST